MVHVHHGPVVYDDKAGEVLFARIPENARDLAARFFKRTEFEDQQEYRFVVSAPGGRPIEDEFYLMITPELRSVSQGQDRAAEAVPHRRGASEPRPLMTTRSRPTYNVCRAQAIGLHQELREGLR